MIRYLLKRSVPHACWLSCWFVGCGSLADGHQPIDFDRDIRPLLSDRCFACHGPDESHREADLRLDQWETLDEDRGGYQIIKPGDAQASELVRRITSSDPDEAMPPSDSGKPLSAEQIAMITRWVDAGAVWKQHWAYEQPKWTEVPPVTQDVSNWIDAFVAEKQEVVGGTFSPPADRITLARRLCFDLTGLPLTPSQAAFMASNLSPNATLQFVDELLASPAFGERMASYWLDLTRFADTVGYHGDQDHNISLYRDYVIDAFNDNRPFDQFTLEQIAGDLLPNPSSEQLIATGYNRMLQTSHEGGVQPKEYLAIYAADRVRNVSAVWMGATVGCAQCHDHKFDPYSARDFYALAAFFADVDEDQHFRVGSNALPTKRPPEERFLDRARQQELAALERELKQLEEEQQACEASNTELPKSVSARLAEIQKQRTTIRETARLTMITKSVTPRVMRVLPRGNWQDDSGPIVLPAIPEFMGELNVATPRATRRDLAEWLVDSREGAGLLTARVFVNRLWLILFGEGLSRSVEDFGGQGEAPSHPQLLDRLSLEFVNSGWDVKYILRQIVSSRTYQQASLPSRWQLEHDPENRLLSRQNRYRIPAEMVRDTALACGELLVRRVGGPSVKPYQPEAYYRHLNFPVREYEASVDDQQWRRGIYVHWQRQFLHPMMRAFDAPTREECTAQRSQSNTPLAALVWLNDPSFVEAARGLALRSLRAPGDDRQRIANAFQIATARTADVHETDVLFDLLEESRREFAAHPDRAVALLNVGLFQPGTTYSDSELAAWTSVARAVLNLNETYTRN